MKVLYIITNSFWYGDNRALFNIMPYLIKYGIVPYFLVPINSEAARRFSEVSANILYYDENNVSYYQKTSISNNSIMSCLRRIKLILRTLLSDKKEYYNITEAVKTINPNLIHTNNSGCFLGYRLAKDLNIPHVWHIREYGDKDAGWMYIPSRKKIIDRMRSSGNFNIAITNSILNYFNLDKKYSVTIYDGPIKCEENAVFSTNKTYFLYVGRLFPNKGVELLIESFEEVVRENTNAILKIAGDGDCEYVNNLKEKVQNLHLSDNVIFLGYRNDIAELMAHSKAVIVPSFFEAFGFITAEAMYNGTQVIGFNSAGTKEQMDNVDVEMKKNICLRFCNKKELVDSINYCIKNPVEKQELKHISDFVKFKYSDKKSAQNVYFFYNYIQKNKKYETKNYCNLSSSISSNSTK